MELYHWFLAILGLILSFSADVTQAGRRWRRSGGFPKFPALISPLQAQQHIQQQQQQTPTKVQPSPRTTCGTRGVYFSPPRSGVASAKIVGGAVSPYGAYPWQVELLVWQAEKGQYEHQCGGAVIGSLLVLTAAHCVADVQVSTLRVATGQYRRNRPDPHEQTFRAQSITLHPNFRHAGPYSNDIAVIRVKDQAAMSYGHLAGTRGRAIRFDSYVNAICIPQRFEETPPDTWCTVTGWGAQHADDIDSLSVVLRAASVPLVSLDKCRSHELYGGRRQPILDSMLCAGHLEGGIDACGGDSGGPLACEIDGRFVLTGVVSWGDGCAKKNRPGVYTRVSHFVDWIEKQQALAER